MKRKQNDIEKAIRNEWRNKFYGFFLFVSSAVFFASSLFCLFHGRLAGLRCTVQDEWWSNEATTQTEQFINLAFRLKLLFCHLCVVAEADAMLRDRMQ